MLSTGRRQSKLVCEPPGGMRRSGSRRAFRDLISGFCEVGFGSERCRENEITLVEYALFLRGCNGGKIRAVQSGSA